MGPGFCGCTAGPVVSGLLLVRGTRRFEEDWDGRFTEKKVGHSKGYMYGNYSMLLYVSTWDC